MFIFSNRSKQYLSKIDPRLQLLMTITLSLSTIDFGITAGLRTTTQQQAVYQDGKSQLDGITKISKHQLGLAVDLVCYHPNTRQVTYEVQYYYYLAGLIQSLAQTLGYNIAWGGWWKFQDCCHWEIKD